MCIEIGCLGEGLVTTNISAANLLTLFQCGSRMLRIDMDLKLAFVGALLVTKNAGGIGVLLSDVAL